MNSLEKRVEKLEGLRKTADTMSAIDCEQRALEAMIALKKERELRESMGREGYAAYRRECMEKAPSDSPLGRLREIRRQREARREELTRWQ